ncbi:MarR family winged helix-turn-helix transcriptional regulator [Streptomyces luteosporeus]|uniref:HTH marR-type domain-containing protein n=1 Tax=Streptomyces luteosporeus TaxID=173856 RepID=A0ABN3U6A2_9ACTN
MESRQDPRLRLVHRLRAVTVGFDLLAAKSAACHGLHPTDLRALAALLDAARAERPMTPGRLGEQLRLNSAGTTILVDRLERLGLVRRERDTADRRRVLPSVEPQTVDLGWSFFGPAIGTLLTATTPPSASSPRRPPPPPPVRTPPLPLLRRSRAQTGSSVSVLEVAEQAEGWCLSCGWSAVRGRGPVPGHDARPHTAHKSRTHA